MANKNRKPQVGCLALYVRREVQRLLLNRKAASVVLSTVILTAGVIAMGIAVLYWTQAMGKIGNLEYSKSTKASINAVMERIGFEYISYSSTSKTVTAYIINWGRADNITISRVFILDSSYQSIDTNRSRITLLDISSGAPIQGNNLRIGKDGFFVMSLSQSTSLTPGSMYTLRVVTARGRTFHGSFTS